MTRELNKLLKLVGKDHEVHLMFNVFDTDVSFQNRVYVWDQDHNCICATSSPTMTIALQRAIKMFKERTK